MPTCEIKFKVYQREWNTSLLIQNIINYENFQRDKFTNKDYKDACEMIKNAMLDYNKGLRGNPMNYKNIGDKNERFKTIQSI